LRTDERIDSRAMVKVVQVVHYFLPRHVAGTEIYTYTLSKALMARGHEVRIFTREDGHFDQEYVEEDQEHDGIPVRTAYFNKLGRRGLRLWDNFYLSFRNDMVDEHFWVFLNEFRPDVVHFQHTDGLSGNLIAIAKEAGVSTIFTLNDYWTLCHQTQLITPKLQVCDGPGSGAKCAACVEHPLISRTPLEPAIRFVGKLATIYRKRFMIKMLNSADLLIAPSGFLREKFIAHGVQPGRIKTLDYGIVDHPFHGITKRQSTKLRIGYVGTIVRHKGVHVLIEAFNRLSHPDVELRVYGDPKVAPDYYQEVKGLATHPGIRFLGSFDNGEIATILSEIDLLVVPSIWPENSPLTIHEAFLARIPVIASNIGGIPGLVEDGKNGLLFTPGDSQDLLRMLCLVVENRDLLEDLVRGTPQVKTIQDNAEELEGIYQRLVREHAGHRMETTAR